jgi:PAS domain-containing protein
MNKKEKRVLERTDDRIDFDFGEGSPVEGITSDQFSIAWSGSLMAHETGEYEFRIRTPNGARLYLNRDLRKGDGNYRDDSSAKRQPAQIDLWVSSGSEMREATTRLFLLGGRPYPMRLDFFKYKDKNASIRLEWKPPHGVWSVLSGHHLSPEISPGVGVIAASFPPDDSSLGYERGTAVSKSWHDATTRAAVEGANVVLDRLGLLNRVQKDDPDLVQRRKDFAATFAARAFRRPLTDELRQLYVDRHFVEGLPPETAVKRSVLLVLKSPRFLYPELGGKVDDYTVAGRLALSLWDSLPVQELSEAASQGRLHTSEQIHQQAMRMMKDPRTKAKLGGFFDYWLAVEEAEDIAKDQDAYPDFNDDVIADLRVSLQTFVENIVWSDTSDYRQLLLADYLYLNPPLADIYGVSPQEGAGFVKVAFDPAERAGIFTHPYLLAAFSYHKSTSPIHRGVFLTRNVLGRFLKPPPMAIEFMDDRFDQSLTMREKVTELTKSRTCMACHATINPLGFSLENYDAIGRFRTLENDKPINAESDYTTSDGEVLRLRGARDLAQHAATSRDARLGFIRQMFHHTIKQAPAAYNPDTLSRLDDLFQSSGFHMRDLLVEMVVTCARHGLNPKPPGKS